MIRRRSFLKWAGNKYSSLDNILAVLPKASRLIEPFAGSGVIFLNADYPQFIIGEENTDLIALFQALQQEGPVFISDCKFFFNDTSNTASYYYQRRDEFNQCTDPRQRALLFLYLNRHGYNGLCRYSIKSGYNVPFGDMKAPYFPEQEMQHFHQKSQQASFLQADFKETFKQARSGDVIYCDPPYAPRTQFSNFSSYTHKKFGEQEQIALAELAASYASKGITVVISNHDTTFTRHQYRDSQIISFPVKRTINCQGANRLPVQELLAIFKGSWTTS